MKLHVLFLAIVLCAACTQNEIPPAAATDDSGVVKAEKTNCETSGPMNITPDASGFYPVIRIAPRSDQVCALILPIESDSLGLILSGAKLYEYRRSHPSDKISHVVFFNIQNLSLVAVAEVEETIAGPPQELALSTWMQSGQSLEKVASYFGDRNYGFAIALKNYQTLSEPISLAKARELDPKFQRPYGYLFLDRHPAIEGELRRRLSESSL